MAAQPVILVCLCTLIVIPRVLRRTREFRLRNQTRRIGSRQSALSRLYRSEPTPRAVSQNSKSVVAFLPKSLETSDLSWFGERVLSPDSNAAPGVYSVPLPLSGDADKLLVGPRHVVLRATESDVEAVVRQPRRGGRAAHREAAEPVL